MLAKIEMQFCHLWTQRPRPAWGRKREGEGMGRWCGACPDCGSCPDQILKNVAEFGWIHRNNVLNSRSKDYRTTQPLPRKTGNLHQTRNLRIGMDDKSPTAPLWISQSCQCLFSNWRTPLPEIWVSVHVITLQPFSNLRTTLPEIWESACMITVPYF